MKLQLLRNATLLFTINDKQLLIDPMLADKDAYPSFPGTDSDRRNPTAGLPVNETALQQIIEQTDAVLLTHIHLDHWDDRAKAMLPKGIPVFCQPENVDSISSDGFQEIVPIPEELTWNGITISRTGGRHGVGEIGARMGTVSGYVIQHDQERVYIAGDTIWCEEVEQALRLYQPAYIIVNGGAARFKEGDPIIMDIRDILVVCKAAPQAKVYVVHLEAVNHVTESRAAIRAAIEKEGLSHRCFVPDDGGILFDV